jgi:hypothetical protein
VHDTRAFSIPTLNFLINEYARLAILEHFPQLLFFFVSVLTFKTIFVQCTQHVLNLYLSRSGNSMNNLSSYCGLTDARMKASEKDLPVPS